MIDSRKFRGIRRDHETTSADVDTDAAGTSDTATIDAAVTLHGSDGMAARIAMLERFFARSRTAIDAYPQSHGDGRGAKHGDGKKR